MVQTVCFPVLKAKPYNLFLLKSYNLLWSLDQILASCIKKNISLRLQTTWNTHLLYPSVTKSLLDTGNFHSVCMIPRKRHPLDALES